MTTTAQAVAEELRRGLPVRVSDRRVDLLTVLAQGWHLLGRRRVLFDEPIRVGDDGLGIGRSQPGPELDDEEFGTVQHVLRRYGALSERDLLGVLASLPTTAGEVVSVELLRDWLAGDDEYQRAETVEQGIRKSGLYSLRSPAVQASRGRQPTCPSDNRG